MKIALYARYSSDNRRDASIEDQLRLCRLHAEKQGWTVVDSYTDRAISGASLLRPGIQELIGDAIRVKFAMVLAEAMARAMLQARAARSDILRRGRSGSPCRDQRRGLCGCRLPARR
ncbi:DNA invertase Pin-like site-specific DNA recombinase [Bradyrhizobium sp. i1.8.4]